MTLPERKGILHQIACTTHKGRTHRKNQDTGGAWTWTREDGTPASLVVVADGVSSGAHSEDASRLAAGLLHDRLEESLRDGTDGTDTLVRLLLDAAEGASRAISDRAQSMSGQADATTLVAGLLVGVEAAGVWCGDSRAYVARPDDILRLTRDHSWAEGVVSHGLMTVEQAARDPRAHMITRWLGPQDSGGAGVESFTLQVLPGDVLLCASDGLYMYFSPPDGAEREMGEMLRGNGTLQDNMDRLAGLALDRGGHDDITGAAIRVVSEDG
jgi:serine/threonine protein phosphatase PrpC